MYRYAINYKTIVYRLKRGEANHGSDKKEYGIPIYIWKARRTLAGWAEAASATGLGNTDAAVYDGTGNG